MSSERVEKLISKFAAQRPASEEPAQAAVPWRREVMAKPALVASPSPEDAVPQAAPPKPKPDEASIYIDVDEPWEVARRFLVSRYWREGCPTLRYWRGNLLRWTGTHYAEIDEAEIKAELWEFLSTINLRKFKPQEKDVNGLLSAIKSRVILPAEVDVGTWLGADVAPWGDSQTIVCKNGVVRLSDGRQWSHDPKLFALNAIETEYQPDALAPRWQQFLDELWPGDDGGATRDTLGEFFGLVLTDETRFQKGFILVGPARSGKGTIARMLRNLLGAKNYCGPSLNQLSQPFGLESFIGKKIAVVPDARTDGRTNRTAVTERLLSVIGEDPQDINRKNKGYWSGILRTRVMILSNELPEFKDDTGVIATRFIILQMHTSFLGREDPDLEDKLRGEQSGILNWAIEGWQRLAARGKFVAPGNGELNDELAGIGSSIKAFVGERCEIGAEYRVEIGTLYIAYREWSFASGLPYADRLPGNHFSGKLRSAYPGRIEDTRPRINNPARKRMYVGIRLRRPGPPKPG
jgi:putative DNA primase/helicase